MGVLKYMFPVMKRRDARRLGSDYGGWTIPVDLLDENSICYLAGTGLDISFDLELIDLLGCQVYAFDPTPGAVDYVSREVPVGVRYLFEPIGLWSENTTKQFYAPRDASAISHSIVNLHGTADYFEAPCETVPTVMRRLGHQQIDLLKLDIEGAEYDVLDEMFRADVYPVVLCVEFDQPCVFSKTRQFVNRLLRDYDLYAREEWNFHFVRKQAFRL
jgi:FkbM family methyltransferase